jgi:hypothetical protein
MHGHTAWVNALEALFSVGIHPQIFSIKTSPAIKWSFDCDVPRRIVHLFFFGRRYSRIYEIN